MNVTLRQLRAFVAVARTGSFTSAAETLFLTQSALSGLIKELEQVLGLRLFDRTTRRLQLSSMGETLYPKIIAVLNNLDEVGTEIEQLKSLNYGRVRVAVSQQLAASLLPQLIAEYKQLHPDIKINLIDCDVENVVSHVYEGDVDWGIGPERDTLSDIEFQDLFALPFYAALSSEHTLASKKELTWTDLRGQALITLKGPFSERLASQLPKVKDRELLENAKKVNYMSTALSMVYAGLGITICLPYVRTQIQQYQLTMLPMVNPRVIRRFYIFKRKGLNLSPAANDFKDFLLTRLDQGRYFDV